MPSPPDHTPLQIRILFEQFCGRSITDADAGAVAGLINALNADMRALRAMKPVEGDEPATTYAAVEGQP